MVSKFSTCDRIQIKVVFENQLPTFYKTFLQGLEINDSNVNV